jgi:hypothetical protein
MKVMGFMRDITDEPFDPETDGPGLLREVAGRRNGKSLYFTVVACHYSTLGMCELIGITPRELTARALAAGLIHLDDNHEIHAGPIHLGQGFEHEEEPGACRRKSTIADAYWPPECFEALGALF